MIRRISLSTALLLGISLAVLVGVVPAGMALDHRLAQSLIERAREDIQLAPRLLADRNAALSDALMMRAKDLAHAPGLAAAVANRDRAAMLSAVEAVRPSLGAAAPLVAAGEGISLGTVPDSALLVQTRAGRMPVALSIEGDVMRNVALAPLEHNGRWLGAAGVASPLDEQEVRGLKGLARSDVIITPSERPHVIATTLDSTVARELLTGTFAGRMDAGVREVSAGDARYLVISARLSDAGWAVFARSVDQELAVLPALRRTASVAAAGAVLIALLVGFWTALRVSQPVRQLANAAQAFGEGQFDVALPHSRIAEVATVAARFDEMRRALQARIIELRETNAALTDRGARLAALQSDLLHRERLAAAGRLVAQLAHEIRNPVASLRNCLEVVKRRMAHDPEGAAFADLAINELLRMHELAEQMLDLSRPRPGAVAHSAPVQVARDVVRLVTAGVLSSELAIEVTGDPTITAGIAADALKQVLLNVVQNAREAVASMGPERGARVRIEVARRDAGVSITIDDNGSGIPAQVRERMFDPFFSTKADLHGVGLGLFVAEGLVRGVGGRIASAEAPDGGARIVLELPLPIDQSAVRA